MFKNIIYTIYIIILVFTFYGCKNDVTIVYHYPPDKPINPVPANGSQNIVTPYLMSWTCSDPNQSNLVYDIYLDINPDPQIIIKANYDSTIYELDSDLDLGTEYYWKVIARNEFGLTTSSEVWHFTASNISSPWKLRKPMPTARYDLSAVALGKYIYAIGGVNYYEYTKAVEKYDPALNDWINAPDLNYTRGNFVAITANNKIYVIGGMTSSNQGTYFLNSVEEFNPISNNWTIKANMPTERSRMAAIVINNTIYVVGGIGKPNGTYIESLSIVEKYNINTNTWTVMPSLPVTRAYMSYQEHNNKLYLIGGADAAANNIDYKVYEFDPIYNTFTQKQSIPTPRIYCGSGIINNNIFVIGGADPYYSNINETYDVLQNSWQSRVPMPISSAKMSSVSINGKIYIIGGYLGYPLNRVYRYDPSIE